MDKGSTSEEFIARPSSGGFHQLQATVRKPPEQERAVVTQSACTVRPA
jgi:hypothetical protein